MIEFDRTAILSSEQPSNYTNTPCLYIFQLGFSFSVARRVEMIMHLMQMNDNRSWNETHVTVELETGVSSGHLVGHVRCSVVGSVESELAANGHVITKRANGGS